MQARKAVLISAMLCAATSVLGEAPPVSPSLSIGRGAAYVASSISRAYSRIVDSTASVFAAKPLRMNETYPGAGPEVIKSTDKRAAQVKLSGSANDAVNVIMPDRVRLRLDNSRQEDSMIIIEDINAGVGATGAMQLSPRGMEFGIGATRPAIPTSQRTGTYNGRLSIVLVHP